MPHHDIVILGAGISGLTTAYWLKKAGLNVRILEAREEAGGTMQSQRKDGFLIDYGPNSGLDTTPLIGQLVRELQLDDQVVYANHEAQKRYILKGGRLEALPTDPSAFIKTPLFSTSAKLNLLKEPFVSKTSTSHDVSIAEFVRHRLGKEFLDHAVDPFVSGIYAGDPEKLSVKWALPRLYALEREYGSLLYGTVAGARKRKKNPEKSKQSARQFSFKEGMQALPNALAKQLEANITYGCTATNIASGKKGYKVEFTNEGISEELTTAALLSTVPAHSLSPVIKMLDAGLSQHLNAIGYPPVMVLYLVYPRRVIRKALDGFGFLIPQKEKRAFLGAIWNSVIFPNRTDHNHAAFTLFVGGARQPYLPTQDMEAIKKRALAEFKEVMLISPHERPVLMDSKFWPKAIPQYNLGYGEHESYFQKFERSHPGFYLGGNLRGGISVGDCIKNSGTISEGIVDYITSL